ncbi:clusterin-associated protein 1 isoform X3 [Diorhabda sublineata]|uniref:clusterin-associated protein 1 isoform X3 n=1 Tax=Diorhabda sublineata TaxID=1163346 RepID=UPI0024E13EE3|nr:clusterin-associated protein 1 isoform X3 [Diorhabda sublineata]
MFLNANFSEIQSKKYFNIVTVCIIKYSIWQQCIILIIRYLATVFISVTSNNIKMSYRDIRNLIETLRVLGYPNLISMESFRSPNFPLVADLLLWLSKRFDPDTNIPPEIDTEDDRVKLIRNVAEFMAIKGNIRLNTKRLYQADGYVIKELLKITSILHEALLSNLEREDDDQIDENILDLREFDITDKISELKFSRQLAGEVTKTGSNLYNLLTKEVDLKVARHKSIVRQFELSEVESGIREAIKLINIEVEETKQLIENVAATEASLDSKIEKRNVEIGRYEKRLQALKKVSISRRVYGSGKRTGRTFRPIFSSFTLPESIRKTIRRIGNGAIGETTPNNPTPNTDDTVGGNGRERYFFRKRRRGGEKNARYHER